MVKPRDMQLARRAKKHGMHNSLRIILEARKAGIPISLGFALIEQESSNGANVFGRDDTSSIPDSWKGQRVTKQRYDTYKRRRGTYGAQGVGPAQLTSPGFQDDADELGGCWKPRHNIRVGFSLLARLIGKHGTFRGLASYNAGETGWRNGKDYATAVTAKQKRWHDRLS